MVSLEAAQERIAASVIGRLEQLGGGREETVENPVQWVVDSFDVRLGRHEVRGRQDALFCCCFPCGPDMNSGLACYIPFSRDRKEALSSDSPGAAHRAEYAQLHRSFGVE